MKINYQLGVEAKQKLDPAVWNYLVGGAEDEIALQRNRLAFQKWSLLPRVLTDVSALDLRSQLLGIPMQLPVIAAPIGGLTKFHEEGDSEWAKGLAAAGVIGTVSGVARIKPEEIIQTSQATLLYQLYYFGDDEWVGNQLRTAEAVGYKAIVVTVDTAYYTQRERDILAHYDARHAGWRSAPNPPDRLRNRRLDWNALKFIQSCTRLPVILKGACFPADVERAFDCGIQAIWVSNHGGRQLDNTLSSLEALVPLVPVCKAANIPLIVDGGIRRGSHVLLALLLGATAVSVGRLPVYGLAAQGAAGVKQVFENLETELRTAMGLMGITNLEFDESLMRERLIQSNPPYLPTKWDVLESGL